MSNIVVPELGESVVEARVARWLKKAGDRVETGEAIVELETEKIDLEVNAEKPGVISSIARKEGDDVKIGEVLGVIDENAAGAAASPATASSEAPVAPTSDSPVAATHEAAVAPTSDSPVAPTSGKVAPTHEAAVAPTSDRGVAPTSNKAIASTSESPAPTRDATVAPTREAAIAPTSNRAIALTSEKEGAPASVKAAAPTRPSGDRTEERVRMTKRRQTIARRLVEAQHTAAMLTTFNEADMTAVMALRERRKESFKKEFGVSLGIASFFVKASIAALRAFPALNAEIQGDEIVYKHYFDIGMAVGAEGGLVVPVLRDADRMSFPQLEQATRDFAKRAGDGSLTLEDLRGGTFTITNGGVFGSLLSTPILNPPQVGILGLHKIQDRVVPLHGQPVIRPMMYMALSYDHRIVDGREAVQFLAKVKDYIEDPGNLLLEA
jgi:2-oxoglutarate dehydrogenase E2 component (dihydrolipoamide succinyltransferase)